MDPIAEYVREMSIPDPLRVIGGRVVRVVDATHVEVDIGDKAVVAYGGGVLGASVRLLVGRGTCEVLTSAASGPSPLPVAMAAGTLVLAFAGGPKSAPVAFPPGRFSAPPVVTATLGVTGLGISLSAVSVSVSGCTIGGSSSYSGDVLVQWLAVQMTPANGAG